jgi:hypothetical protein
MISVSWFTDSQPWLYIRITGALFKNTYVQLITSKSNESESQGMFPEHQLFFKRLRNSFLNQNKYQIHIYLIILSIKISLKVKIKKVVTHRYLEPSTDKEVIPGHGFGQLESFISKRTLSSIPTRLIISTILIFVFEKLQITSGPLENSQSHEFGNLQKPEIWYI